MKKPADADEYIAGYPGEVQALLQQLRTTVKKAAPGAEETISYGMPAYKQQGMLLYFAVHKKHIGFYPFRSAIKAFQKELAVYQTSAGTVQFPLDKPLPLKLITQMVKFRVKENLEKVKNRKK